MAPNHGGDSLGSILGPVGCHWVQKMGQNRKKLPCPKFEFSITPRSSIFPKKWKLRLWHQITVGTPSGPSWGLWGPIGSKNCVKTVKNYHAPKIRIFYYPAVIDFSQKKEVTVMAPNHGGDPLGSILGPMGSHWVQKMCQNRKKLPCPKIRIFDSSVFFKKWKLRLWRQITVGTP